ncbi:RNase_P_p30 domain-containing protein [Gossypium australe]|uniref:RNase_P_p30 domain-containing protein n=1 Tax=Gossypium australe TaxID=47621 RepID=A0A5B6X9N2_9ROSI|nr:RNase_P_p30 domain-containing protein [Gossypium australe]
MGFFDLNIPYTESTPLSKANSTVAKSTRIKIVIKAMELGYTGIAYNRTIRGVMSDRDRCSIPLLGLSSLLNVAPFLSSSVNFHRDLLGVPRSSPFRQYTRLTVCIDTASQSQALNSGNPILKTYDIVAVRPLNQNAFDHACEKAEVDIISIDFSDKLPFRLKLPMVKAAIKRGIYFEITYSDLIVDVHQRRQIISNAKVRNPELVALFLNGYSNGCCQCELIICSILFQLLLDWTRGKNIILSSAAPSVCEVRGPNDVANLASLLGLSMERAKAAISKNCRSLLTNALRRKHFFKEVIRVEAASSSRQSDSEIPLYADWLKWDPISSGEGDLLLDDMAKSFSASTNASKTVKAIDFDSIIDKMPAHGFQVKDLISGSEASFQPQTEVKSFLSTPQPIELSVRTNQVSENSIKHDLFPETDDATLDNTCSEPLASAFGDPQKLDLASYATKTSTGSEEVVTDTVMTEKELETRNASDAAFGSVEAENQGLQSKKYYEQNFVLLNENVNDGLNAVMLNEDVISHQTSAMEIELDAAALEISPPSESSSLPPTQGRESKSSKGSCVFSGVETIKVDDIAVDKDKERQETTASSLNNMSSLEKISERMSLRISEDDAVIADQISLQQSDDEMRVKDDSLVPNHENQVLLMEEQKLAEADSSMNDLGSVLSNEPLHETVIKKEPTTILRNPFPESNSKMKFKVPSSTMTNEIQEVAMELKRHGEDDNKTNDPTLGQRISGKSRRRHSNHHHAPLFPLRRNLYPVSFKRKAARKSERRVKMEEL